MEMRSALNGLGFALCVGTAAICLILHVATFLTIISLLWIVPLFFLLAGAVLCSKAVEPRRRLAFRDDKVAKVGFVLLVYAVLTFVYFYKTTGGATSVGIVDGQYVSMHKS
jgi:drug/metabolite transporter (DMT)-like permease